MKRVIVKAKVTPDKKFTQLENVFADNDGELAAFVGKSMIMTPGDLIFDSNIADGSVRYWCALRSYFPQVGEIRKPPTQEEMALMLNMNRKTAGTHFNLLRATRWVTVLKVIKKNNLEMGFSYLLHDTRMKIDIVLRHDAGYIDFLLENIRASNKKLRDYCRAAIIQLPDYAITYLNEKQYKLRNQFLETQTVFFEKSIDVQKSVTEKNLDVQKSVTEKNLDVQKSVTEKKPDVQKSVTEKKPDVQKSVTEKKPDVQKSVTEKKPDVQKSDSEDIYNTACVHAPTHRSISVGDNITTTTSGKASGSGGDNLFGFFQDSQLINEILWDMEHDQMHFGKKSVHALKNCLKRKHYQSKDGKPFTWICTEEKVVEMLIVLFVDKPNSALNYLRTLIFADSIGEFLLKPKQRKLLNEYHKRVNPDYQEQQRPNKRNETPIEQFNHWLNSSSDRREFKPQPLREGQKVRALTDLVQFDAKAESVTALVLPAWITDLSVRQELINAGVDIDEAQIDRVSNLSLCFVDEDKLMDYETVCKALELGLLAVEED